MTAHHQHVIDYFDQTHNDYRWLWGIDRHFGLHCGFFDGERRRHVVPSSRRIYVASLLFYPLGLLLYWIGLRTAMQTRGIASGYYQYQARQRGLGVYGIFRAEK